MLGITTLLAGIFGVPAPNGARFQEFPISGLPLTQSQLILGLIPQAPMHTASLVVMGSKNAREDEESTLPRAQEPSAAQRHEAHSGDQSGPLKRRVSEVKREIEKLEDQINEKEVPLAVVEQRVSNLVQGAFCQCLSK